LRYQLEHLRLARRQVRIAVAALVAAVEPGALRERVIVRVMDDVLDEREQVGVSRRELE
jgi:hypothetical protein